MSNYIKGIDVSQMQGVIDWNAVAAEGYRFCLCRCYVGNNGKDSLYDSNMAGSTAANINAGCYHFPFPLPTGNNPSRSPQAQAAAHFAAAGNVKVVVCDLEWPVNTDWSKWGCSASQIVQWTLDYLQEYERLSGVRPIIYTYPNYMQTLGNPPQFAQYQLWIASYESSPTIPQPWNDWVIWQNSGGTGPNATHLPNGAPVDTDYAKDLSLWGVISEVSQTPPPAVPESAPTMPDPAPPVVIAAPIPPPMPPVVSSNIFSNIWGTISGLWK